MIKYIIYLIIFIVLLFGLIWLSEKLMAKYAPVLDEKFRGNASKRKLDLNKLNNTCLIISFIFFLLSLLPDINKTLFITMAFIFLVRSLKEKMSVPKAFFMLIGSFSAGVVISLAGTMTLEPALVVIFFIISVPMLIIGFK
ncbi:MAG: hypothetical protein ACQESB_00165 [Elusimicrobiota bacterium]